MRAIAAFTRFAFALNRWVGKSAAWLILVTVVVCASVAISRYAFGFGRIWIQEIYIVTFGVSFLLVAPYAYGTDSHVRVDILQRSWPPKKQAAVELLGVFVFLLPWLMLVIWSSWRFVSLAWSVREPSPQAGGLQGYYLVKTVIPVFAILMIIQGLGVAGRSVLILAGRDDLLPPKEDAVVAPEG